MELFESGLLVPVVAAIFSAIAHAAIHDFWKAMGISVLVTVLVFEVLGFLLYGHVDGYALIRAVNMGVCATVVSLAVGGIVRGIRRYYRRF